ncbi:MAG: hypothetical protein ACRDYY_07660, partial [Acidimicrobiales bacterium]
MSATATLAIEELRRRNPVNLDDVLGSGESPEALAQLERIFESEPTTALSIDPFSVRRRPSRRALVVTGVAAAAGAAAVAATFVPGAPGGLPNAAASVLNREAAV